MFHNLFAILSLRHPCLGDDLGAVQRVVVSRTSICLTGSDSFVIVGKAILKLSIVHGHFHELAAVPGQGITVVVFGVSNFVIGRT